MSASARDQSYYQVRFEWGVDGAAVLAPAHVIVLVDGLSALPAAELAERLRLAQAGDGQASGAEPLVLAANLRNRGAIAERILTMQAKLGDRAIVSVIAVGELDSTSTTARFTVADILASGAVIDALMDRGIDHISPEAAVAAAAYSGLKNASKHLIAASGGGREATAIGRADQIARIAHTDASAEVPELADGVFRTVTAR